MSEPVKLLPSTGLGVYEIRANLYQCGLPESPEDWDTVFRLADVVVSLGTSIEDIKPDVPRGKILVRWNIEDGSLPNLVRLDRLAEMLAGLVSEETSVLVHCGAGLNRSGLLTALTMRLLTGESGRASAEHVRQQRPGALCNGAFNEYLNELQELESEEFPELEEEPHGGTPAETTNAGG